MMIGWGWWLRWVWVELNQHSVNTSPDSSTTWCKLDTNTIRNITLIIYQHPNTSIMSLKTYFCCDCLHFFNLFVKSGQAFTISRSLQRETDIVMGGFLGGGEVSGWALTFRVWDFQYQKGFLVIVSLWCSLPDSSHDHPRVDDLCSGCWLE